MNNNAITDFPSSSRQEIFESFRPQITVTAAGDSVVGPSGTTHEINRRKKRKKMCRFAANVIDSPPSQQQHKSTWKKPEPCTECGKQFSSWKALFGHMRCHPERPWRGINPPSNSHRRSFLSSPPDQSASEDLGLGFPENFTEEDLEVATCLVLLSTAISMDSSPPSIAAVVVDRVSNADVDDGMAVVAGPSSSSGLNNNCLRFECSSCKRVFGSHQALGGHRASHKNVKGCFAIARSDGEDEYCQNSDHHGYGHGHGHGHGGEDKQLEMVLGHRGSTCMRVLSSGGGQRRSQYWEKGLHEGEPLNPSLKREEGFGLDLNLPAAVAAAPLEKDGESSSSSSGLVLDLRLGI